MQDSLSTNQDTRQTGIQEDIHNYLLGNHVDIHNYLLGNHVDMHVHKFPLENHVDIHNYLLGNHVDIHNYLLGNHEDIHNFLLGNHVDSIHNIPQITMFFLKKPSLIQNCAIHHILNTYLFRYIKSLKHEFISVYICACPVNTHYHFNCTD